MKSNKIYVENKHLVLILDVGYQVVNVCSTNNAHKLIAKQRAEVVAADDTPTFTSERAYLRPTIIRLSNSIKYFEKQISASRKHIFQRDGYVCAYCTKPFTSSQLTVDHIMPKSRGGKYTWKNLVTCCKRCNAKKDDRTPDEANMKLHFKPYRPTLVEFLLYFNGALRKGWDEYLIDYNKKERVLS